MPEDRAAPVNQMLELALKQLGTHALILLDPDGKIVGWFAGGERLFGYRAEEIIGEQDVVLFTPEDVRREIPAWECKTAAESGEAEDDRWQLRKDGARFWVSGTLTALRDDQGKLIGFAKITRDRTDQRFQRETLESRIDALQQARVRKNNFISTLAHELRNPLNAISSAGQLLEQFGQNPEISFATATIRRQVEFMTRMVDDLLEVTRVAAGKVQLKKERVVLQDIVKQAIETCRPAVDERAQELHQLLPDVLIPLDADPTRLRQVFINLIANASKYTPQRGTIWVKATTEDEEAVVRVTDTGIGIAPEVMPHIFEIFTQAEYTTRPERGLGIGLSVVKDTVALHGGIIQATSPGQGKGSEFTVRLPLPDVKQVCPGRE